MLFNAVYVQAPVAETLTQQNNMLAVTFASLLYIKALLLMFPGVQERPLGSSCSR